MMLELVTIDGDYESANSEIQERILFSSKGKRTRHLVAKQNAIDVAFVSIDEFPEVDCLALYELFVPTRLRNSGLGAQLLKKIEDIAIAQGYERVALCRSPLELGFPTQRLVAWYNRQGYVQRIDCPTELEKRV